MSALGCEPTSTGRAAGGGPHVVAIGGGHGLATSLRAVRRYAGAVTAIVSVADDGGSSGRLRQMTGIPAPGDIRRCLVALADPASLWARAMEHRFAAGDLAGHALGNLVIAGLAEVTGDFGAALDAAAALLGVAARVVPATSVPVVLKAEIDGAEVLGQVNVAGSRRPISRVSIVPPDAAAPAEAIEAIAGADQVVIGPGSLFTSVLASCVVPDVREALAGRDHGTVYVCNLRPQLPETAGFSPADHLRAVLDHGVNVHTVVVDSDAGPVPERPDVRVVTAPLAAPGRGAHDPAALAGVLAAQVGGGHAIGGVGVESADMEAQRTWQAGEGAPAPSPATGAGRSPAGNTDIQQPVSARRPVR